MKEPGETCAAASFSVFRNSQCNQHMHVPFDNKVHQTVIEPVNAREL